MARASTPVRLRRFPAADDQHGSASAEWLDVALGLGPGYLVFPKLVPEARVERALRLLNLEIVRRGMSAEEIAGCVGGTFFPHLRWDPEVLALRSDVERVLEPRPGEEWADTQLLLRFPDEAETWPLTSHVDRVPQWAGDRSYRAVVGVALSRSSQSDGCLAVWPASHVGAVTEPALVELEPGDVVVMHPGLQHSSTLNTGGRIRYATYFRLLHAHDGGSLAP